MTIKMKEVGKVKNNCFEVEIEYIHANGCIDFKTFKKQILDTSNISDLEKFIESFEKAATIIGKSSDEGNPAPSSFEGQLKRRLIEDTYVDVIDVPDTSLYVMVMQDKTDDGEGDYTVYAVMRITKIIFIDSGMKIFNVVF